VPGTLLAQIDMIRMLEAMSADCCQDFDPDTKLDAGPHAGRCRRCPVCAARWRATTIAAPGSVHFDRCEPAGCCGWAPTSWGR
jgi:hypothetical protein